MLRGARLTNRKRARLERSGKLDASGESKDPSSRQISSSSDSHLRHATSSGTGSRSAIPSRRHSSIHLSTTA